MKKIIFILFLSYANPIISADFMHDLGIGFWSKLRNVKNAQPTSYGPNLQYMPRCNFKVADKISLSLAAPIAIGARFHPLEGNFFQLQLPATVLFNFGHGAYRNQKAQKPVGGYFGTGFNYIYSIGNYQESDYGIIAFGGLGFNAHHHSLGTNLFYTHAFRFTNNYLGAGIFYTFGYFD